MRGVRSATRAIPFTLALFSPAAVAAAAPVTHSAELANRCFAVASGHVAPDVEQVVETHSRYDVVRKLKGVPAEIAQTTDPRSGS